MKLIQNNPKNASAILLYYKDGIVLQKRDTNKNIFYPGYWSFFGGAKKKSENYKTTAIREIMEETGHKLIKDQLKYFFQFDIEFPLKNKPEFIKRVFFTYEISNFDLFQKKFVLNEGTNWGVFNRKECLNLNIAPYDRFAIDIFYDHKK